MEIEQIRPRLWRWTATHPDWSPEEGGPDGWEPEVSSHALVEADALVLIDPLVPADDEERFWHALDGDVEHHGPPQILLTGYWHARSSQTIFDRYPGARVWVHTRSGQYYCAGSPDYERGTGKFMTQADAQLAYYRPAGDVCK